jgi:hypothetical protein
MARRAGDERRGGRGNPERLSDDQEWDENSGGCRDRYVIFWQPAAQRDFVGAGAHGRWLAVQCGLAPPERFELPTQALGRPRSIH